MWSYFPGKLVCTGLEEEHRTALLTVLAFLSFPPPCQLSMRVSTLQLSSDNNSKPRLCFLLSEKSLPPLPPIEPKSILRFPSTPIQRIMKTFALRTVSHIYRYLIKKQTHKKQNDVPEGAKQLIVA